MDLRSFYDNMEAGMAKNIIMILIVLMIFAGVFGTIALNLENLGNNSSVAAIPGGTVMIGIIGLIVIVVVVVWIINRVR